MSITIMVSVEDQAEVEQFIRESDFPNRLRLALYITHYPGTAAHRRIVRLSLPAHLRHCHG